MTSVSGLPLAQAQVSISGTRLSARADTNGRFLLVNVPAGRHTVVVRLIGFGEARREITLSAGESAVVDFQLRTRVVELEGVVVTGTAIDAEQRTLGNSIVQIPSAEIEGAPSMDDALRGKAVGLTVQGSSGQAGAGSELILRGLSSVNGRNSPLIYVDGIRLNERQSYEDSFGENQQHATILNAVNPQDIDRVEIIKGAAATTLYGTEAGAGVVQIFTKRGSPGETRWTFTTSQALASPVHVGPESDPTGLHINDCAANGPIPSDTTPGPDPGCPASGSWLRNAWSQKYQLAARGGSENVTFYTSAGFERQEGIVNVPDGFEPQSAQNLTLRANFTFRSWEKLEIAWNSAYTRRDLRWLPDGDNAEGLMFNVTFLDQGETPEDDDSRVFELDLQQDIDHFTTGANVAWTPRPNLRHRFNVGLDWSNSNFRTERPFEFWNFAPGTRTVDIENSRVITVDYAGSWTYAKLPYDLGSTFSWGGQFIDREELGIRGDCSQFTGPGSKLTENCEIVTNLNEDRDGFQNGGFFVQEQIGWKNRLFVTGGVRFDSHSSFGDDLALHQKIVSYPKLQAAYTLSDHDSWPEWWETLRVRAAWGQAGEPPNPTDSKLFWQVAGADENRSGFIIQNLGNPLIGPERTSEVEGGFDASLLDGRVVLSTTWFHRQTTAGLINFDLTASNGVAEQFPDNVGSWESRGLETSLDVLAYQRGDLGVRFNTRYQLIDSKMEEIGPDEDNSLDVGFNNRFKIGDPWPSVYGFAVTNPNEVGVLPVESDTLVWQGRTLPKHELSVGASVSFGRLSLDVFGRGQFGHVLLDDQAQELAAAGLWPECVAVDQQVEAWFSAGQPAGGLGSLTAGQIGQCSRRFARNEDWFFAADYFRIQQISLSYRIPERWLPGQIRSATLQFRANNVALFTGFPGTDPDALLAPSVDLAQVSGYTLPLPRTYGVNLRIDF